MATKILIADDEPNIVISLEFLLKREGYEVVVAHDGVQALERVRAERGSGTISINGAAARKAAAGDLLIIATYAVMNEIELQSFEPDLVYVDSRNRIINQSKEIPVQAVA